MPAISFAIPILPGKVEAHVAHGEEVMGSRRAEYAASRKSLGIRKESAWHQETPNGTLAVVYIEADDPGAAMAGMASSDEPFDVWFRESITEIFGIDLSQPMPPPVQVMDASF
ncbi:MAG: hypothetical protein OER12_05615 [Acidimicrobiia bacterium]|nr:hypothetical protein [Acidimicrobiia bacterium]